MTPYVYRAPKASVENVKSKTCLDLTADFCMCVLKKVAVDKCLVFIYNTLC